MHGQGMSMDAGRNDPDPDPDLDLGLAMGIYMSGKLVMSKLRVTTRPSIHRQKVGQGRTTRDPPRPSDVIQRRGKDGPTPAQAR